MIYEAPFHLRSDLILKKLVTYGMLQDNKMVMYKHKGTEVYNGTRSINFRSITKPIPTVLFVHGNRCKIKHVGQDRRPICGICKTKGHYRDECDQMPLIQSFIDLDRHEDEPEAPEIKSWAAAHQYVRDREEHRRQLRREAELEAREKELEAIEEKRIAELEEKENRRRMMIKKRHLMQNMQQDETDEDTHTGTQEENSEEGYHTAGETAKLAKQKELEAIIVGPESKKARKKKGKRRKKRNEETPQKTPESQHISPMTTPNSSPFHPDIGESNGTVCGSQPDEDSTSYDDDETDFESEQQPMEKDDLDLTENESLTPVISSSYPPPGQEAGKEWAEQMDEQDKLQQQHHS